MIKRFIEKQLGTITNKQLEFARLNQKLEVKLKYRNFGIQPSRGERLNILSKNIEFCRKYPWVV